MAANVLNSEAGSSNEYDVRGRRWMDCIGRMVMRPSDRAIASQRVCDPRLRQNARDATWYPRASQETRFA